MDLLSHIMCLMHASFTHILCVSIRTKASKGVSPMKFQFQEVLLAEQGFEASSWPEEGAVRTPPVTVSHKTT